MCNLSSPALQKKIFRQIKLECNQKCQGQTESLKVFEDKSVVLHCNGGIENSMLPYLSKISRSASEKA